MGKNIFELNDNSEEDFYIGHPENDSDEDIKELVEAMLKLTAKKMVAKDPEFQSMDEKNVEIVLRKMLKTGLARFVVSPRNETVNFEIHPKKKC